MNKAAFIIPVYPPHYIFLDFLNKISDNIDVDIILVLSYKSDLEELLKCNFKIIYKHIVLERFINSDAIKQMIDNKIIITFKKYFALNLLKNSYEYCATIDCEIDFINVNNVYEKFKCFCDNKKVVGSLITTNDFRHELVNKINIECGKIFTDKEMYNKLSEITYNFNIYFWFSDIPVYNMSYIDDYFKYIGFDNSEAFISKISWYVFDYIPYVYYCVLFKNYQILNIKDYGITREWSLESMPFGTYKKILDVVKYKPMWLICNTYYENENNINKDDIIVVYHRNDGRYINVSD